MSTSTPTVVLITGANQGLGYYLAQHLAASKKPYTILIGARDTSRGEAAAVKLTESKANNHTTLSTVKIDITSASSISTAVAEVTEKYGHLDILVNNAAIREEIGGGKPTPDVWRSIFETNVVGTVAVTDAFLPLLQKSSDAKIIVISSMMGSIAVAESAPVHPLARGASPYKASKAAMNMILVEWAKTLKGIRVWGVDPGLCATEFAGEYTKKNGRDPREGADIARQCIEGEREDCVGKLVWEQNGETGVRPW